MDKYGQLCGYKPNKAYTISGTGSNPSTSLPKYDLSNLK